MSIHAVRMLHYRRIISIVMLLTTGIYAMSTSVQAHSAHMSASSASSSATIAGCPVFPSTSIWNTDVSTLPVHTNSTNYVTSIGANTPLLSYFGSSLPGSPPHGVPYTVVTNGQPPVPMSFEYANESNPGPYPFPANAPIEGGSNSTGSRHVIVLNSDTCTLYETSGSYPQSDGSWRAVSGATWNLNSNNLRPINWTSADGAGLPILPGLVRYDEVASGAINHALSIAVNATQSSFLWPARHAGSLNSNANLPPMGLRMRLKSTINISSFPTDVQVILTALKHYGALVSDNSSSSWVLSGTPDNRWNNGDIAQLGNIPGSDFEAIDESSLQGPANTGQVSTSRPPSLSCQLFPSNSIWNTDISNIPVHANSGNFVASMGSTGPIRSYFGAATSGYAAPGIPYAVVSNTQSPVSMNFEYASESDPGPYPIPANVPIEGGPSSTGSRHMIVVNSDTCALYETIGSYPQADGSWHAVGGATWNLTNNNLRPAYWTSADGAGLPILPGLVRYDEVASGAINHALGISANLTQNSFLWPARHIASSNTNPNLPPMGLRMRLKANINISSFPTDDQVILTALKHYGAFVSDNGPSSWVLSGTPDDRWNNGDIAQLGNIPGSDFEAIDESAVQGSANSGQISSTNNAWLGGCPAFPSNNIWSKDISSLPVHSNSANFITNIGPTAPIRHYFGAPVPGYIPPGLPYVIVPGSQPLVPMSFEYANESDPGPYPYPANAPIEGGSSSTDDRHVIVLNSGTCTLYETGGSYPQSNGSWHAVAGATWNLNSNNLRPASWTSADGAGLPMLPGLITYDEVASGAIHHALRLAVNQTQNSFLWPARHAGSTNPNRNLPPMGLRLRLKANIDISSFPPEDQIILNALKHYGAFVSDNGPSSFVLSGTPDSRWTNTHLDQLSNIPGSDFEAIDESSLQISSSSGQSR